MQRKAANGEFTGGAAPFGSQVAADGIHLEPNAAEQEIIQAARTLADTGLSLRVIAAQLAKRGFNARNGRPFAATQVARMLAKSSLTALSTGTIPLR